MCEQQGFLCSSDNDSTCQTNDFTASATISVDHLVNLLQQDAQLFHDLLLTSGGDVELPKCSYHNLISYRYDSNGTANNIATQPLAPPLTVRCQLQTI